MFTKRLRLRRKINIGSKTNTLPVEGSESENKCVKLLKNDCYCTLLNMLQRVAPP